MKRAVVYYSLTDNTKEAAQRIAQELEAELIRIDFVKALPTDKGKQMMEGGRQAVFGVKPPITGVPANIGDYDDIVLGVPVWASKPASPIRTFIAKYGIAEKITSVFTCSGGGDNDKCIKVLSKKLPNLKENVALCDRQGKFADENEARIADFLIRIS